MELQQATQFSRYSSANAAQVKSRLSCGCEPYRDVFTYNRWKAQGMQVMRGEHAIKLPVVFKQTDEETNETKTRLWHSAVFCRHQVKLIGSKPEPMPNLTPAIVVKVEPVKAESSPMGVDIMKDWRVI